MLVLTLKMPSTYPKRLVCAMARFVVHWIGTIPVHPRSARDQVVHRAADGDSGPTCAAASVLNAHHEETAPSAGPERPLVAAEGSVCLWHLPLEVSWLLPPILCFSKNDVHHQDGRVVVDLMKETALQTVQGWLRCDLNGKALRLASFSLRLVFALGWCCG